MSTYTDRAVIPIPLAKRLAIKYCKDRQTTPALFTLACRGSVLYPGTTAYDEATQDQRGARDEHAVMAEARALRDFFEAYRGGRIARWTVVKPYGMVADQVIPWAYGMYDPFDSDSLLPPA
jgi:hypothetical protein